MNATTRKKKQRRTYTVAEANAMLPLLRAILRDVTELASDLRDKFARIERLQNTKGLDLAHEEEVQQLVSQFESGQEKMRDLEAEIADLGVELKDHHTGLVDFRHNHGGREVYLCWKLGEPIVAHWHELDSGFSGRQRLDTSMA